MKSEMNQIINGCIKGKQKARKELFKLYHKTLLGTCLRYSRDKSEAEDILLEGFIQIYSRIETYSGNGSFEGWMRKIIINTAIDYFRKNKKENFHQNIDDYNYLPSDEADILKQISAKEIMSLIQSMPQGYRVVFNLYAIEGYSHKEIADLLKVTESTSKSQVRKARIWLMKRLKYNCE